MTIKKFVEGIQSFKGKRIAITGATSGVGKQLFYHLMNKEASVVLLVRNLDAGNKLKSEFPNREIDIIEYDQASFKKIEKTCNDLIKKYKDLYAIVFDAGNLGEKKPTEDNYPGTIGVNYFGVRHFIDYISPKLENKVRFIINLNN